MTGIHHHAQPIETLLFVNSFSLLHTSSPYQTVNRPVGHTKIQGTPKAKVFKLTCLSVLLPIPLWPVLALWGVHDWLMARESSSRAVKTAAYVVLAVVSVLFLVDFFHCVSIFL